MTSNRYPLKMVRVYGITTGLGFAIRAWTLFRKEAVAEQISKLDNAA